MISRIFLKTAAHEHLDEKVAVTYLVYRQEQNPENILPGVRKMFKKIFLKNQDNVSQVNPKPPPVQQENNVLD